MAVFEAEKSKIKMVILKKAGHKNKVWYSPTNQNRRSSEMVVKSMLRRFKMSKELSNSQVVQFYENGILIYKEKI